MYLNYLEKNEKIAFLKLAHIIAKSDNVFCDNEKIVINSYCAEMCIDDIKVDLNEDLNLICSEFILNRSKKIVILELMSIINANGIFKESEKKIINELLQTFHLDSEFLNNVQEWSKALINLIDQGTTLVLGDK